MIKNLNDSHGDWDHPEFCLEANDGNEYVYFNFDDIQICFLEHNFCVKKKFLPCKNERISNG